MVDRGAQIKEELAALDVIDLRSCSHAARTVNTSLLSGIRDALLTAQQEAEAWEAIGRYADGFGYGTSLTQHTVGGSWTLEVGAGKFREKKRLEAITLAAAWCRAELAPAIVDETEGCTYHVIDMRGCTRCDKKNGRK